MRLPFLTGFLKIIGQCGPSGTESCADRRLNTPPLRSRVTSFGHRLIICCNALSRAAVEISDVAAEGATSTP
jgi:hypothetical protein